VGVVRARGAGEEAQVVDGLVELEVDDRHRRADVGHLDPLEIVEVGLDGVGQGQELLAALPGSGGAPGAEGLGGDGDGGARVGGVARRHPERSPRRSPGSRRRRRHRSPRVSKLPR
jgi:hypothetical protein